MITSLKNTLFSSLEFYNTPITTISNMNEKLAKLRFGHRFRFKISRPITHILIIGILVGGKIGCSAGPDTDTANASPGVKSDTPTQKDTKSNKTDISEELSIGAPKGVVVSAGRAFEESDYTKAAKLLDDAPQSPQADLLRARIAAKEGNFEEAIRLYHGLTDVEQGYESQRVIELSGVLASSTRYEEAVSLINSLLINDKTLTATRKLELAEKKASLLKKSANPAAAIKALDDALELARSESSKNRISLALGRALILNGKLERAKAILGPLSLKAGNARIMTHALTALNKAGASPAWSAEKRLARAKTLMSFRAWKAASSTLAPLVNSPRKKYREEAAFIEARILFKKRRHYKEALVALEPIAKGHSDHSDEAAFMMARALSRIDRDPEAIKAYKNYAKTTTRPAKADEAIFLSGRLEFYLGRHKSALRTMEQLVGDGKTNRTNQSRLDAGRRRDAHFIAGLSALLQNKATKALPHLKFASKGSNNDDVLARNEYWTAVAKSKKNAKTGAMALRDICKKDPSSWYALLSMGRLRDLKENYDKCVPEKIPPTTVSGVIKPLKELCPLSDFFAKAGLFREAANELRRAEKSGTVEADAANLIHHYVILDAPHFAIRRAIRGLNWPPSSQKRWLADSAYPTPYVSLVEEVEKQHGLPPGLLHAIARKESLFDPKAVSRVGAMGMMQMMPRTYEANRKRAGLPPLRDNELPGPQPSIRAAGFEFASLFKQFDSLPLAIMAYNGGPAAVSRWLDRSGGLPMDVFVEKAGFAQTRNYVKRVFKNLFRYRVLAGAAPPVIPTLATRPKKSTDAAPSN